MPTSSTRPSAKDLDSQVHSLACAILNTIHSPSWVLNRTGTVLFCNTAVDQMFPFGKPIHHFLANSQTGPSSRSWDQIVKMALDTKKPVQFELTPTEVCGRTYGDNNIKCQVVALELNPRVDLFLVQAHLDAPPAITEIDSTVSKQRASLGKLAALVAHELNNPLDGILRYINLALRTTDGPSDEKLKTYLSESRNGLLRMTQIICELLAFAKNTDGEFDEKNVNDVVEESIRVITHALETPRIVVAVDFQSPHMPLVRGSRLYQICCNLLRNAVDAMPNGGRLSVTTAIVKDDVVIRVADTGHGLPADPTILFKPFYTTKPRGKGTGLGLSICKDFVEEMGGTITAARGDESGAVFTVRIPATSFASSSKRRKGFPFPVE